MSEQKQDTSDTRETSVVAPSKEADTSATPTAEPEPKPEPTFGDNAPAWARGKSAKEVLGIVDSVVQAFPDSVAQPAPVAPAVQQPVAGQPVAQPQADTHAITAYGADDYVTGAQLNQALADAAAKQVTPAVNQTLDMAASTNLALVKQARAKEFSRYGPEIVAMLSTVPKNMWTVDNLEKVVKLVLVDHLDELQREGAQQLASEMEPTLRSTGVAGSVPVPPKEHSLESEKIPEEWKRRAEQQGVTEETVREFCTANSITAEQFYKQFETPPNRIVEEIGTRKVGA